MITFGEFRRRLLSEFNIIERPMKDFSFVPNQWHTTGTELCWERLIPPGKRIRMPVPDYKEEDEIPPEELPQHCMRLRINPRAFGLPWN